MKKALSQSAIIGIAETVSARFNDLARALVQDVVREIKQLLGSDASSKNIKLILAELMQDMQEVKK